MWHRAGSYIGSNRLRRMLLSLYSTFTLNYIYLQMIYREVKWWLIYRGIQAQIWFLIGVELTWIQIPPSLERTGSGSNPRKNNPDLDPVSENRLTGSRFDFFPLTMDPDPFETPGYKTQDELILSVAMNSWGKTDILN